MLAVAGQHLFVYNPKLRQEIRHDRYLEQDAHQQRQHKQGGRIGLERNLIDYRLLHLIRTQKAESEGKDNKVVEQHTQRKQHDTEEYQKHGIAFLLPIQRGRDKAVELNQQVGERYHTAHYQCHLQVDSELRCQFRIDKLRMEITRAERSPTRSIHASIY